MSLCEYVCEGKRATSVHDLHLIYSDAPKTTQMQQISNNISHPAAKWNPGTQDETFKKEETVSLEAFRMTVLPSRPAGKARRLPSFFF